MPRCTPLPRGGPWNRPVSPPSKSGLQQSQPQPCSFPGYFLSALHWEHTEIIETLSLPSGSLPSGRGWGTIRKGELQGRPGPLLLRLSCHHHTHHGLIFIRGMGAQVKNTVKRRNDFLPQTSERAPMRGALRKDSRPWKTREKQHGVPGAATTHSGERTC